MDGGPVGVSGIYFGTGYLLAWICEWTRIGLRSAIPLIVSAIFLAVGLLAHGWDTLNRVRDLMGEGVSPLGNWFIWFSGAAWGLSAACLIVKLLHPRTSLGIFLLPPVFLLLIAASFLSPMGSIGHWNVTRWFAVAHSACLLAGTIAIHVGFAAGLMYLWKARSLRRLATLEDSCPLPSLEWLARVGEYCLFSALALLAMGLLAGISLNLAAENKQVAMPWTDPALWPSLALLAWIVVVSVFTAFYRPARTGQKVAYLAIASFLLLVASLAAILGDRSAHRRPPDNASMSVRYPTPLTSSRGEPTCFG